MGISGALAHLRASPDAARLRVVVVGVAVVQAAVLGVLARRGSWLSDDLDFLVHGSRGFAPDELLTPVNDHVAPGLRFTYAMFAEVAPLNYDFTVAWRVVLQALAITLLGFLLLRLLGPSRWVVTGTLLYALTPLSMPSFMSLSSAVNNLPAHVFGLLLLHATLDWYAGHRRRAVAYGPLSLLASLAFWEKSGLILLTVIALALYVRDRPLRGWARQTGPFAAALLLPLVAFGTLYLTRGNPSAGRVPPARELLELAGRSVAVPVVALVGGPWDWSPISKPFGLASAPAGAIILGAVVSAFLLLVSWRVARRALLLWGAIAVYVLVTLFLVSYGRFTVFGSVFTMHYHYWSDISIPLTLAVVLTARSVRPRTRLARTAPVVALCCLLAWTTGVVVSDARFARLWGDNPAGPYFATLTAELEKAGPGVNVWDTQLPSSIVTVLATNSRLSPVLQMARIPVSIQAPGSEPYLVDPTGRLQLASFVIWSRATPPKTGDKFCDLPLRGENSVTLPLKPAGDTLTSARWFARIGYFSNRENKVEVELVGQDGRTVQLPSSARTWPAGVTSMTVGPAFPLTATAIRLRSTDPETNVCVGDVAVGLPQVLG